jgi:uncharacterized protein
MISDDQKKVVVDKLSELKPLRIGIFGSYARGDENPTSDLDILVHLDYSYKISLLDLVRVQENLSETLGISVDLVTDRALSPYVKPYVTQDIQYILG